MDSTGAPSDNFFTQPRPSTNISQECFIMPQIAGRPYFHADMEYDNAEEPAEKRRRLDIFLRDLTPDNAFMHVRLLGELETYKVCDCGECTLAAAFDAGEDIGWGLVEAHAQWSAMLEEERPEVKAQWEFLAGKYGGVASGGDRPQGQDLQAVGSIMDNSHVGGDDGTHGADLITARNSVRQPAAGSVADSNEVQAHTQQLADGPSARGTGAAGNESTVHTREFVQPVGDSSTDATPIGSYDNSTAVLEYHAEDHRILEDNLSYEISLIECGTTHRNDSGMVIVNCITNAAPPWLNEDGTAFLSPHTRKPMRVIAGLPNEISKDVPAWELVNCIRMAAFRYGLEVRYQDILDRMNGKMANSTMAMRLQRWLGLAGALPITAQHNHGFPSQASIESVCNVSIAQAKMNTWWNVIFQEDSNTWLIQQPKVHKVYRGPPLAGNAKKPWYIVNYDNPQASERVREIQDAIIFLEIKGMEMLLEINGAESNVPDSLEDISNDLKAMLEWVSSTPKDQEDEELRLDLIVEFRRWRNGCKDTLSAGTLSSGLMWAESEAERQAILAGDYSMSPGLQYQEALLRPEKAMVKYEGKCIRAEMASKAVEKSKRSSRKRKACATDGGDA